MPVGQLNFFVCLCVSQLCRFRNIALFVPLGFICVCHTDLVENIFPPLRTDSVSDSDVSRVEESELLSLFFHVCYRLFFLPDHSQTA